MHDPLLPRAGAELPRAHQQAHTGGSFYSANVRTAQGNGEHWEQRGRPNLWTQVSQDLDAKQHTDKAQDQGQRQATGVCP